MNPTLAEIYRHLEANPGSTNKDIMLSFWNRWCDKSRTIQRRLDEGVAGGVLRKNHDKQDRRMVRYYAN